MIFHIIIVFFICAIFESFQSSLIQQLGSKCLLDKNRFGVCQLQSRCESTQTAFEEPIICSYHELENVICCETNSTTHVRHKNEASLNMSKFWQNCDKYEKIYKDLYLKSYSKLTDTTTTETNFNETNDKSLYPKREPVISHGSPAKGKQFRQMALIGYGDPTEITWNCGGTLISENFVLTAGHCLYSPEFGEPRYVRLGELDIESTTDDAKPQDFNISEAIKHPDYNPPLQYNDIALLKLEENVQFTNHILPACLYDKYTIPFFNLQAAGWGDIEHGGYSSNHLLYVDLFPMQHSVCNSHYDKPFTRKNLKYGINDETQICAGGIGDGKDTCEGDSGGPLQLIEENKIHKVVGITSFGTICGSNVPGVYTRVSAFIPWIESIVWP